VLSRSMLGLGAGRLEWRLRRHGDFGA
jgi:hypothetical protein